MVPVEGDWSEVFFSLTGPVDEKVQVEVVLVGSKADVAPCVVDGRFSVQGRGAATADGATLDQRGPDDVDELAWAALIADNGHRKVFIHLHRHQMISEAELVDLLGSARAVRKFGRAFGELLAQAPFEARVETTATGKRYVRL